MGIRFDLCAGSTRRFQDSRNRSLHLRTGDFDGQSSAREFSVKAAACQAGSRDFEVPPQSRRLDSTAIERDLSQRRYTGGKVSAMKSAAWPAASIHEHPS
jgi:hypothetical protein